jgi:5-methylthioadenosine/S-adenosylhomocysteine deaminase
VILTARLVLPISGPPLQNGGVAIQDGVIRSTGQMPDLRREFPGEPCETLGDAVLLPGLVNAHTHLELTGLRDRLPLGRSFSEWLLALLDLRRELDRDFYDASSREGAAASLRSGVTCVADITASGASLASLKACGLRGVVYQEVLGPDPSEAEDRLSRAEASLRALQAEAAGSLVSIGLSPHAPYSLSEALLERCADLLRRRQLRATMHLAESPDEATYIGLGLGPLATDLLPAVGRQAPSHRVCGESPTSLLARVGLLSDRMLAVHAVQVGSSDLALLKQHAVALALCPRSNHHLRVGLPPLPRYLGMRLRAGLGTDSLASNETLSLWDEMRFALTAYGGTVTPRQLLTMATLGGAAAIGLDDEIGSLERGKRADLIGVGLDRFDDEDPYGSMLRQASEKSVILTMVDGKILHRG